MNRHTSRRQFLNRTLQAGVSAAALAPFAASRVLGANERIRLGGIGTGDRGSDRLRTAKRLGAEIVALCDVNEAMLDRCDARLEQESKRYIDYHDLLARGDIDRYHRQGHWHHEICWMPKAKKDIYIEPCPVPLRKVRAW